MKTYYHAGLDSIKEFYIPFGGLHMGGKGSALEAALRKLRSQEDDAKLRGSIILHSVHVDDSNLLQGEDLGNALSWEKSWDNQLSPYGYFGWKYKNIFEPDTTDSICLFNLRCVGGIFSRIKLSLDEAELELERYESRLHDMHEIFHGIF